MVSSAKSRLLKPDNFSETFKFYFKPKAKQDRVNDLAVLERSYRSKLKITLVTETWAPEINGVAHSLLQLCKGLQGLGHQIQLIRPEQKNISDEFKANQECLVWAKSIPKYADMQFGMPQYKKIQKAIASFQPDIVHIVTEGPLGLTAQYVAQAQKIPVSSGFHSAFHDFSRFFDLAFLMKPVQHYLRWFHNNTQLTCVPSQDTANALRSLGFNCPLVVVGRGVDHTRFSPQHLSTALRQQWKVDEDTRVMLYVGRLSPEKEVDVLISAYRSMQVKSNQLTQLVIVGDGPDRERLEQLAMGLDVIFMGSLSGQALSEAYASADVFVFASQVETFGNVVLEAMASGLPVVAYNAACASVHVRSQTGWLSELGRTDDFIRHIQGLPSRKTLQQMGMCAAQDAAKVGWQHPVQQFEQALYQVVEQTLVA